MLRHTRSTIALVRLICVGSAGTSCTSIAGCLALVSTANCSRKRLPGTSDPARPRDTAKVAQPLHQPDSSTPATTGRFEVGHDNSVPGLHDPGRAFPTRPDSQAQPDRVALPRRPGSLPRAGPANSTGMSLASAARGQSVRSCLHLCRSGFGPGRTPARRRRTRPAMLPAMGVRSFRAAGCNEIQRLAMDRRPQHQAAGDRGLGQPRNIVKIEREIAPLIRGDRRIAEVIPARQRRPRFMRE